jgi:hypothetical protein
VLTAAALEESLRSTTGGEHERLTSPSDFDRKLREEAAVHIGAFLDQVENGKEQYAWSTEPGSFNSGIEAWLQHELLLALNPGHPGPARGPQLPAVARVVDTKEMRAPWTISTPLAVFLLVPANLIDRYVALQQAVLTITVHAPDPYDESDRWCRTNLLGGGHMEAAARGEMLGVAYAAAQAFLVDEGAYATSPFLGDPSDWILHAPGAKEGDETGSLGPGDTDVEILIRAPLRFGLFQEWGHSLTELFADRPRGDFGREQSADNTAVHCFRKLEEDACVEGVSWKEFFGRGSVATGMSIHLQMKRVDLLRRGLPRAVEWLCLSTDEGDRPAMTRLSLGEVMLRCAGVATMLGYREEDQWTPFALLGSVDEMQVFFSLVAALLLIRTGGTADLGRLQSVEWEAVIDYYEARNKALEKVSPEELERLLAEDDD